MSRKKYTFRYSATVTLDLDPKEYEGCSVGQIERILLNDVLRGNRDYEQVDVQLAAMDLASGG